MFDLGIIQMHFPSAPVKTKNKKKKKIETKVRCSNAEKRVKSLTNLALEKALNTKSLGEGAG